MLGGGFDRCFGLDDLAGEVEVDWRLSACWFGLIGQYPLSMPMCATLGKSGKHVVSAGPPKTFGSPLAGPSCYVDSGFDDTSFPDGS